MQKPSKFELVEQILDEPNAEQLIAALMAAYGKKSAKNATFILGEATAITQSVMLESEKVCDALGNAAQSLLSGAPTQTFATNRETFRWLVPICVALAPSPRDALVYDGEGQQYVSQMLDLLKERNGYNPHNPADRSWAKENGYFRYLETLRIDLRLC